MQRLIVTSAAYRQSSKVDPVLLEKDLESSARPWTACSSASRDDSRFRACRRRLAEYRDRRTECVSVPAERHVEAYYGGTFSAQVYEQSHGKDLYRRSMYTFWRTAAPALSPPSMRPIVRSAPCAGRSPTRHCNRWCS